MRVARIKEFLRYPAFPSLVMLVALIMIFSILAPARFPTSFTVIEIFKLLPEKGTIILGVTLLMIAGEFDLSVGSLFALIPSIWLLLTSAALNPWSSLFISLCIAIIIGGIHAFIVLRIGLPSFIATLGGLMGWRALELYITGGYPIHYPVEKVSSITWIFVNPIGPILHSLLIFLGILVTLWVIANHTRFGKAIYAVGGKPEAARKLGIDVNRTKAILFMLVSLLAGIGGIIQTARFTRVVPFAGRGFELDCIAGAVIGGTSLFGGIGSLGGGVIGALTLPLIDSGLMYVGAPGYVFRGFIGIAVVFAVIVNKSFRTKIKQLFIG